MCAFPRAGSHASKVLSSTATSCTYDKERTYPRLTTDMLAILQVQGVQFGAELLNISNGGAAFHLRTGLAPKVDEHVLLTLIDGTPLPGSVVWQNGKEYGIAFQQSGFQALEHLSYEEMGSDYFNALIRIQRIIR